MLVWVTCALLGAPSYASAGQELEVKDVSESQTCTRAEPEASFTIEGPARPAVSLYLELPATPKRPAPVRVEIALDGKLRAHVVRPKRGAARYARSADVALSALAVPVRLAVGAGQHTLRVVLPRGRAACVGIVGVPAAAPVAATVAAAEPVSAAPATTPAEAPPLEMPLEVPPAAPPEPVATPPEVIRAHEPTQASPEPVLAELVTTEHPYAPFIRLGPTMSGVLPRADLNLSGAVGLAVEVPLALVGAPTTIAGVEVDLAAELRMAWSPLSGQTSVIVPGRGATRLIQTSLVFPVELGASIRIDLGWAVHPHAGLALATEIVRSTVRVFSTPASHDNDVALGVAAHVGGYVPLGPGGLVADLCYRKVRADLGALSDVAQTSLSVLAVRFGYLFSL